MVELAERSERPGPWCYKVPSHVMGSSPVACLDSCIYVYELGSGEHVHIARHIDAVMVHTISCIW